MATRKSKKMVTLEGNADPRAPLDSAQLLAALQPVLKTLEADLLARARSSVAVDRALRARHESEVAQKRTADAYDVWLRNFVVQVAAAWVLSCVFVRTLEDRGLLGHARIAGPGALDSERQFSDLAPSLNERDYLLMVFRELTRFPATEALFDAQHNPVWLLAPSKDAAKQLLDAFRTPTADAPALRFGQSDTRFLGDLYQDLSADVRERFALLQTPGFVEEFILDRTLEPAIAEFGIEQTNIIDPTCGSGHFLLGAFARLVEHRRHAQPGVDVRQHAIAALGAIAGVDLNPYAIAIARFRLTLAALEMCGFARLDGAPSFPLNLVVGDSLLHRLGVGQTSLGDVATTEARHWKGDEYALVDDAAAKQVLTRRYSAVVGNPPYITVKDPVLRERYREAYKRSAAGTYSLGAPFTERFYDLAREEGFVGLITANSFMKREFGKRFIEVFLRTVDVTSVINTSGAHIPGHGTPTVMIFGRNRSSKAAPVLAVLAKRDEPGTPSDPACGRVWSSIAANTETIGYDDDYITVAMVPRAIFDRHPWSLGGGGASELRERLEARSGQRVKAMIDEPIGRAARTGLDDLFMLPPHAAHRSAPAGLWRSVIVGEVVRDWRITPDSVMFFPYDDANELRARAEDDPLIVSAMPLLWPYRTHLKSRSTFQGTIADAGLCWYEYQQYTPSANRSALSITFAFVSTHNHFALDHGGSVFKQSSPVIKLAAAAAADDHIALLALMNTSVACFWMKQVMMNKGGSGIGRGVQDEAWEARFEFDGTKLANVPLPNDVSRLASSARPIIEWSAVAHLASAAQRVRHAWVHDQLASLRDAAPYREEWEHVLARMVALQEDLDWKAYELFGLLSDDDLVLLRSAEPDAAPTRPALDVGAKDEVFRSGLHAGHRPFEITLHRSQSVTAWFERNGYRKPDDYESFYAEPLRRKIDARLTIISRNPEIALIERPEYKRRWTTASFDEELRAAATQLFAERIEAALAAEAQIRSLTAWARLCLTTELQRLVDLVSLFKTDSTDVALAIRNVAEGDCVPFLAAYRYSDSGLEKRRLWEGAWELQRSEDAGLQTGGVSPPPKYENADFREGRFFQLRGRLDVPKQRFISYPGCESDEDGQPLYGWAGWNHLQQALALATLYQARKAVEAWGKNRLTPMLAGILELLPWVKQWHAEPSEEYGGETPGAYLEGFLDGECAILGLTRDDLRSWRPPQKTRARAASATDNEPKPKKRGRKKVATEDEASE